MRFPKLATVFLFLSLGMPLLSQTNTPLTVKPGDSLPVFSGLQTPAEEPATLPPDLKTLFFLADMEASKILHPILDPKDLGYLESRNAIVLSDIHRMPGLISKFVALPKMRDYKYPMLLIREEKVSDPIPREKGKVTLIRLEKGKVTEIRILSEEKEIVDVLEPKVVSPAPKGK